MEQKKLDILNEKLQEAYYHVLVARDFYNQENNKQNKLFKKITDLLYKLLKELNNK